MLILVTHWMVCRMVNVFNSTLVTFRHMPFATGAAFVPGKLWLIQLKPTNIASASEEKILMKHRLPNEVWSCYFYVGYCNLNCQVKVVGWMLLMLDTSSPL